MPNRRPSRPHRPARTLRPSPVRGWAKLPRDKLLDLRLCDLGLSLEGGLLRNNIRRLYRELKTRGFQFRPHVWLSNEWFTPDGIPGIGIPFYLAHPRLLRLEREFMLEAEGRTADECLKLLRHEAAHALLNAYRLHHRRDWQKVFGRSSQKYPDTYLPKPYSKRYVVHLDNWYAQAHPHEDWAETFAVWLKPNSDWRTRYQGWPALKKLEYVDRLMEEIHGKRPAIRNRRTLEPLHRLTQTLRDHYSLKQKYYGAVKPEAFDRDLLRLFSSADEYRANEKAPAFLRRERAMLIDLVGRWSEEHRYRIGEVLQEMIKRSETLRLRLARDEPSTRSELIACLTATVLNKLHSGGFRVRL